MQNKLKRSLLGVCISLNVLFVIYLAWERDRLVGMIETQAKQSVSARNASIGSKNVVVPTAVVMDTQNAVDRSSVVHKNEERPSIEEHEGRDELQAAEFERARLQAEANWSKGAYALAVEQMLWCYRNGHLKDASASNRIRLRLLRWSEKDPIAYKALVTLRDEAKIAFVAGQDDRRSLEKMLLLCRDTADGNFLIEVFDGIQAGDPRKKTAGAFVFEPLVQRGEYNKALETMPFGAMLLVLDDVEQRLAVAGDARAQSSIIASFGNNVEALAGAGRNDEAKAVIKRLLEIDPSGSSRPMIEERLRKVGRLDILYSLR